MPRFHLPLVVLCLTVPAVAGELRGQSLAEADSLLARGDTSGALAVYETLVKKNLRNTEAHYRAGTLYMTRHTPGDDLSAPRRKAEEHFRYATRFEPDSAKYWLALAELFRGEDWSLTRMQVRGLVENAREAVDRTGDSTALADIAYRQAREEWERYEHYGRRVLFNRLGGTLNEDQFMRDWDYVEAFLQRQTRADPTMAGEGPLRRAEEYLADALVAEPSDVGAAGLAVVLLGEESRWEEALAVARRTVRAAPARGPAWALLGLAYARRNRWREAQAAFDTALARMSAEERRPYENLGLILRRADQLAWEQAPAPERATLDSLYWKVATPLLLTEKNEVRTEFLARLTYAMHRWSDPLRGHVGWESDMGSVYVRYGPPDIWTTLGRDTRDARNRIVWVYPRHRLRFVFGLMAGFARSHFAGDSKEMARVAVQQRPTLFDNIPLVATLDTVAVQAVQFRGAEARRTDVGIFAFIPVGRMVAHAGIGEVGLTAGAIVQRNDGREVERVVREDVVRTADTAQIDHRTWRLRLAPDDYLLRVEAHVPQLERGARSLAPLDVRRFTPGRLELSDVLLARRVGPRDSAAARWSDFLIEPSAGRYAPEDPMAILWEVYDPTPDSTGVARYSVSVRLHVEEIERRGFLARVVGGVSDAMGLTVEGDDHVEIVYDRDVTAPGGVQVEHLAIDLENAPEGRYTVTVTVHDRVADRLASSSRTFVLTTTPLGR